MNLGQAWQFNYIVQQDIIRISDEHFEDDIPEETRKKYIGEVNHPRHRIEARKECLEVLDKLERYKGTSSCAAQGQNEVEDGKVTVIISGVMYMQDNSSSTENLVEKLREIIPSDVVFRLVHYSWSQKKTVILEEINNESRK